MMKMLGNINRTIGAACGIPYGKGAFMLGGTLCTVLAVAWAVVLLMPSGWHTQDDLFWSYEVSLYSFGTTRNEEALKALQHHRVTKLSQLFDTLDQRDPVWL